MAGTVEDVLRVAAGEVGYSRWDDPEEGTKYGRWYAKLTNSPYFGKSGVPYCAMWVSWVFFTAGVQCEGFPRAVAIDTRDGFSRMVTPQNLQPGDAVGFDWDSDHTGDHVGIVKSRVGDYVTIRTYEGNTGNGEVKECVRHISQVTCGVRPYYKDSTSPAKGAGRLDVDGVAGPNTISEWQRQMGTAVDGVISEQIEKHDRYRRNVWSVEHYPRGYIDDYYDGSQLVAAVQKACGLTGWMVDGDWGELTTNAIQRKLKSWGYYTGAIDGDFGHHSVESLQRSLNDGKWRS